MSIWIPLLGSALLRLILLLYRLQLVEQRLVTYFQDLGCLTAVPASLRQHPFDGFPFRLHGGPLSDFQE